MTRAVKAKRSPTPARLGQPIDAWVERSTEFLITTRRHIHANPELSWHELKTADLVARTLSDAGLSPRLTSGNNGVICDIGTGDQVIALRADLDALPLQDPKRVAYRSTVDGACHACGHDVHTTAVLGAGLALKKLADAGDLPGRVRLIFQPSEEALPSGSPVMITEGALDKVTTIFGLHCYPNLPVGQVAVRPGPLTAATDIVEIALSGPGGHTARPHLTADLVYAMGKLVVELPQLVNRRVDSRMPVTLVFGAAHAGEADNAIPDSGILRGTARVLYPETWEQLPTLLPRLAADVVAGTGAKLEMTYTRGVPAVVNDRSATAVVGAAATAVLGAANVHEAEISMGGEDFSYYLQQVPGAMFRLGVGTPGARPTGDLHQASFDVDERAIGVGVRVLAQSALTALDPR